MTDVRAAVRTAQQSKLDGAQDISKAEYESIKNDYLNTPQSDDSIRWLEREQPHLHAAITSDLDYSGYTGVSNGSLNMTRAGGELAQDARGRSQRLNKLPSVERGYRDNGMPKDFPPGDPISGGVRQYEYKGHSIRVDENDVAVSDEQAHASRAAQKDFTTKMSGVIGADVSNPPSVNAAKGYFRSLAKRGASQDQIQKEYGEYLNTFYKHPGEGLSWREKLTPDNINQQFSEQPVHKDGKRMVDCEGYAALTESVLGDLKDPRGRQMFDIKHAASSNHVFTGVFPHGKSTGGFVVDNTNVQDLNVPQGLEKDFKKGSTNSQREFLLRAHSRSAGHTATVNAYGERYANMEKVWEKYEGGQ